MSTIPATHIRSVLIPLARHLILVPNVVVAEVLNYVKPEGKQGSPDWLIGDLAWRGTSVPVISFDGMLGEQVSEPIYRGRIIIMNTMSGDASVSHIGMIAQSIPSLVQVTAEVVEAAELPEQQSALIKQAVVVTERLALIPNLNELERLVLDAVAK